MTTVTTTTTTLEAAAAAAAINKGDASQVEATTSRLFATNKPSKCHLQYVD